MLGGPAFPLLALPPSPSLDHSQFNCPNSIEVEDSTSVQEEVFTVGVSIKETGVIRQEVYIHYIDFCYPESTDAEMSEHWDDGDEILFTSVGVTIEEATSESGASLGEFQRRTNIAQISYMRIS